MLSLQLASEGFQITTVEPVGEGFTEISYIMEIFLEISRHENLNTELIRTHIEISEFKGDFDFIFSKKCTGAFKESLFSAYSIIRKSWKGRDLQDVLPKLRFSF